ncbi:MAG: sulfotransferase family protein [Lewinellaceae bacterium]|nr:sulfotransferase family protein [Lewinellaceae bacterium]
MALQVIGAGWGRTGTESLKLALEQLGFGRCYHMFEVMKHVEALPYWEQLERGETPDYEAMFHRYQSAVDFPVARYYRELMTQYPEAKVILTVRDPEKWYESASKTILREPPALLVFIFRLLGALSPRAANIPKVLNWIQRFLKGPNGFFQGKINDRAFMIDFFQQWNAEVIRTVPPEKLLVFSAGDGWEPLCQFLQVPVPDVPYPHSNRGESFLVNTIKKIFSQKK